MHLGFASVDNLAKFTDAVFKTAALLLGTLWTINRYFVGRVDAAQFRVDSTLVKIPGDAPLDPALIIFRLDLVNTGKTQIKEYLHYIEIDEVRATSTGVDYRSLHRWPLKDLHLGGPIEPGSWSAINGEVACSSSVKAVRVFLAVNLEEEEQWTWHKTFDVSRVKSGS